MAELPRVVFDVEGPFDIVDTCLLGRLLGLVEPSGLREVPSVTSEAVVFLCQDTFAITPDLAPGPKAKAMDLELLLVDVALLEGRSQVQLDQNLLLSLPGMEVCSSASNLVKGNTPRTIAAA